MRNCAKITSIFSIIFFISVFVLSMPVYGFGPVDGQVEAWGSNVYGQRNVPEPNTDFTAIAAGGMHSLGLKGGTALCLYNIKGDFNNDCKIDFSDFAMFAENWLINCFENPSNPACVHK